MDGKTRTDAGYIWKRGGKSVQPWYPNPTWWSLQPRAYRAGIRLSVVLTAVLLAWLRSASPTWFLVAAWFSGLALACLVGWLVWKWWKRRAYRRDVLIPFCQAASPIVDMPPGLILRDMRISADSIRIPIPPHYDPRDGQLPHLVSLVNRRLTGEWDAKLQVRKMPYYIILNRKPEPRDKFTYAEMLPHVVAGKPGNVILGIGTGDEIIKADIYNMYPMIAGSMGTGAGKSSFLRSFVAQESYHGVDDWDLCDVKMVSLAGMEQTPGLRIHRTPDEIRKAVKDTKIEMHRRYQELMVDPSRTFKRRYLILEEQNAFAILTGIDWKEDGGKGMDPVWDDIKVIIVMARQVGIHVIGMYQLLLANVTGGDSTIRTQFSLKILSRFSPQAWDMLVGERPREQSSSVPGRAVAVMEGERKRFQIPYLTVDDAMDLVRLGIERREGVKL